MLKWLYCLLMVWIDLFTAHLSSEGNGYFKTSCSFPVFHVQVSMYCTCRKCIFYYMYVFPFPTACTCTCVHAYSVTALILSLSFLSPSSGYSGRVVPFKWSLRFIESILSKLWTMAKGTNYVIIIK